MVLLLILALIAGLSLLVLLLLAAVLLRLLLALLSLLILLALLLALLVLLLTLLALLILLVLLLVVLILLVLLLLRLVLLILLIALVLLVLLILLLLLLLLFELFFQFIELLFEQGQIVGRIGVAGVEVEGVLVVFGGVLPSGDGFFGVFLELGLTDAVTGIAHAVVGVLLEIEVVGRQRLLEGLGRASVVAAAVKAGALVVAEAGILGVSIGGLTIGFGSGLVIALSKELLGKARRSRSGCRGRGDCRGWVRRWGACCGCGSRRRR